MITKSEGKGKLTRLLIYGQSKVGKTTSTSLIPNSINLDLEEGTKFIKCNKINILEMTKSKNGMEALREVYLYFKENFIGKPTDDFPYDTIIIDTIDVIEKWAGEEVANENDVEHYTDVPYGAGYSILRDKITNLLESFVNLGLSVVVIAHRKKSIVGEKDNMINVRDVDLTGKLKNFLFAWADAIGYMSRKYEEDTSITVLSFKNESTEYLEGGCRIQNLEGKDIDIIKMDKDKNVIKNNWNNIL